MRSQHIKFILVILITCLGQALAGHCNCDKSLNVCENIHVCYNCAFEYLAKSCQESYLNVDKEACRTHLTSGSYKRALYTKAQEECILIDNNCKPEYSATVDVVFMKSCDTGCANYTFRKYENAAVAGAGYDNYSTSEYLSYCQYNCVPPTQDCTVSFASGTCTVFPTNCGGSCLITNSSGVDVYTVTCNDVGCPNLLDPPSGYVNMSAGTSFGALAVYACEPGYNLTGSSVLICNSNGQWNTSAPTCTPLGCQPPSGPKAGFVNYTLTTFGSHAFYECNTGYILNGSNVTTCGYDGNWDNATPSCISINCGNLTEPEFGSVSYTETNKGVIATYTCDTGYNISEPVSRSCLANGSWELPETKCIPVGCPNLLDPPSGYVNMSAGTSFGALAVYACEPGYNLTGSSVLICNSNGQWNTSAPTCTPLGCQPPSGPKAGFVNYTSTTFGSHAFYECNTGYILNGSNVTTCGYDGNWDNATPSCTPINCGNLTEPEFGSITYTETSYGTIATYTCDTGYNISEPVSRSCLANGSWELPETKCIPVDCKPIPNLENGKVYTPEGTTFGKTATFSCNDGFVLLHGSFRVCQEDSQWSGKMPTCKLPGENAKKNNWGKLFIMPCICYFNKTFIGLTEEEIIQQLIADMKIEKKNTKLAINKLTSKDDPRISSKMIGTVSIVILSIIGGVILCSDILTLRERRRALND